MAAACERADFDELAELAHWLKGAGGTVGFNCFTQPARQLEQLAQQQRAAEAEACLRTLAALGDRLAVPAKASL
jgi:HPt (histidine-containing phosphotransfer) domain-containing protein